MNSPFPKKFGQSVPTIFQCKVLQEDLYRVSPVQELKQGHKVTDLVTY